MKKYWLLVFLFVFVAISPVLSQNKKTKWLDGNWEGIGYQIDNTSWTVKLLYNNESGQISITYPSLKCLGEWKFVTAETNNAEFIETNIQGPCDNNVKVIVAYIDQNNISVVYYIPQISEKPIAFALLNRIH